MITEINTLNNLLKSEVSTMREDNSEYIVLFHHEMHDDTTETIEQVMSDVEDEYTMVCALLKKWSIIHYSEDELLKNTSFFHYNGGQVGFTIKVATYI